MKKIKLLFALAAVLTAGVLLAYPAPQIVRLIWLPSPAIEGVTSYCVYYTVDKTSVPVNWTKAGEVTESSVYTENGTNFVTFLLSGNTTIPKNTFLRFAVTPQNPSGEGDYSNLVYTRPTPLSNVTSR